MTLHEFGIFCGGLGIGALVGAGIAYWTAVKDQGILQKKHREENGEQS